MATKYKFQITRTGDTDCGICSEHTTLALAQKAVARLVAMSNGRLTAAAFTITEVK